MKIGCIQFVDSEEKVLRYNENKKCWTGYVEINFYHTFYIEMNENSYELFCEQEKGKEFFEELLVDQKAKEIFADMVVFLKTLKEIKNTQAYTINRNQVEFENINVNVKCQERIIEIGDPPITFDMYWECFNQIPILKVSVIPVIREKKNEHILDGWDVADYLGERFLRNLWKEVIKEDKNRLRMMQYSII